MFSLGLLKGDERDVILLGESGPSLDDSIHTRVDTLLSEVNIFTTYFVRIKALGYPVVIYLIVRHVQSVTDLIAADCIVVGFEKVEDLYSNAESLLKIKVYFGGVINEWCTS